jgi:hypothetical protein
LPMCPRQAAQKMYCGVNMRAGNFESSAALSQHFALLI